MQLKEGGAVEVDGDRRRDDGPDRARSARCTRPSRSAPTARCTCPTTRSPAPTSPRPATRWRRRSSARAPTSSCSASSRDDGECYTIGAVVADHLQMPSLTQVIKMDVADGKLTCERQAEYGYDTVEVELPAVISVGDAINEPRYPSLKAIMGAKKKPLDTLADRRRRDRRRPRSARDGSRVACGEFKAPPAEGRRHDHRGRGHERDGREDRRLARREEADLMADILVYALHYEGAFNKNSLGRRLRGRPRSRASSAASATRSSSAATTSPTTWPARSAPTARRRSSASRAPRASRSRSSTRWRTVMDRRRAPTTRCSAAACSASRSAPASPRAWTPA